MHDVVVLPGGGAFGMEAVAERRATVTALYRPPTVREQALIKNALQDSLACFPVALGGILLLTREDAPVDSLSMQALRDLVDGNGSEMRFYAPDPNQGLWGAFLKSLGMPESESAPRSVTFVRDESEVQQAVAADPHVIGIASSLAFPPVLGDSVHVIPVRADTAAAAALPTYENVGYGVYPLYHHLFVACQPYRTVAAGKFVTYLTSDRGQRAVERAGYLPSRLPTWEIQLTQKPVGS